MDAAPSITATAVGPLMSRCLRKPSLFRLRKKSAVLRAIERLLLEGKEQRKTTAVMVGPTGGDPVWDFETMRGWFPFDVLSLITLATGAEVGFPCIEIRDARGGLVLWYGTKQT